MYYTYAKEPVTAAGISKKKKKVYYGNMHVYGSLFINWHGKKLCAVLHEGTKCSLNDSNISKF